LSFVFIFNTHKLITFHSVVTINQALKNEYAQCVGAVHAREKQPLFAEAAQSTAGMARPYGSDKASNC
jgi:hypothetical protein